MQIAVRFAAFSVAMMCPFVVGNCADPTGTWRWTAPTKSNEPVSVTLKLKFADGKLAGKIGGAKGNEKEIERAEFSDGAIAFTVTRQTKGGIRIINQYLGKLDGDTITGTTNHTEGESQSQWSWDAQRVLAGTEIPSVNSANAVDASVPPARGKTIELLSRILDGCAKTRELLENQKVSGRTGVVRAAWRAGDPILTADAMPPVAEWCEFTHVRRGEHGRFEEQAKSAARDRIYCVLNSAGLVVLDGPALTITNPDRPETSWRDSCQGLYFTMAVTNGHFNGSVADVCEAIIRELQKQKPAPGVEDIRCVEESGLVTVSRSTFVTRPEFHGVRWETSFSFTVDTSKGCNLVRSETRTGGAGLGKDAHAASVFEIEEVSPGVYFPRKGTQFVSELGQEDQQKQTAGFSMRCFEIDDIMVGDFGYDNANFKWDSLPIPEGTIVRDNRTNPGRSFQFGQGTLKEQLARNWDPATDALAGTGGRTNQGRSFRSYFVVGNLVLFGLIATVYVLRRLRHRSIERIPMGK